MIPFPCKCQPTMTSTSVSFRGANGFRNHPQKGDCNNHKSCALRKENQQENRLAMLGSKKRQAALSIPHPGLLCESSMVHLQSLQKWALNYRKRVPTQKHTYTHIFSQPTLPICAVLSRPNKYKFATNPDKSAPFVLPGHQISKKMQAASSPISISAKFASKNPTTGRNPKLSGQLKTVTLFAPFLFFQHVGLFS